MRNSIYFIFFLLFFVAASMAEAQVAADYVKSDTAYFKENARRKLKKVSNSKANVYVVTYYDSQEMVQQKRVNRSTGNVLQNKFYKSGRPAGKWAYYSDEGNLRYERDFAKLVYGECDSVPENPEGLTLPRFGGSEADLMAYLQQKIKFPPESLSAGTTGIVHILFVVDEVGVPTIEHICDTGLDGYCDLVVWEIVENMPTWTPGTRDGEPVKVRFRLPIQFKLL